MKNHRIVYIALLISCITLAVYLPALKNDFVNWDDYDYVVNNEHIRSLDWYFFKWVIADNSVDYWHPLSMISHAADYAIWGLDPMGHHLSSIVIHAVNTLLLVLLTAKLIQSAGSPGEREVMVAAGATGLLFGIHPLHVESVAWITERKDVLCALFYLLSILCYLKFAGSRLPSKRLPDRWYFLALVFFMLALASKAMAVSLPVVLLIIDWYPLRRWSSSRESISLISEKAPFLLLAILVSLVTFYAHKVSGAMVPYEYIPFYDRILIAFRAVMTYIGKMVFPWQLLPFYPYPSGISLLSLEYLSSVLFGCSITVICLYLRRRNRLFLAAWGYYIITLLPVLGLVQVARYSMADRFTYLPSLGPFMLAGLVIARLQSASFTMVRGGIQLRYIHALTAAALCAAMILSTLRQIEVWKDSVTLWGYVIEHSQEDNYLPYMNRGLAYAQNKQFEKAVDDFTVTIGLKPLASDNYNNRAVAFEILGRLDLAIKDYSLAISLKPSDPLLYFNRAVAYRKLGRSDTALEDLTKAVTIEPGFVPAYIERAELYRSAGRIELSLEDYRRACGYGSRQGCDAVYDIKQ